MPSSGENTRFLCHNCGPMRRMQGSSPRRLALAAAALAVVAVALGALLWKSHLAALLPWSDETSAFQPRELVRGGNQPLAPRVAPQAELLDSAALERAADYAGEHGSRALIVSRHDHIVFERYWKGTSFDTPADAQSFTRLLAALATGAAMSHRVIGWPDEPVSAFLGEWSHDPRGAITVRNLMQMSSGLMPAPRPFAGDPSAEALSAPLARTPGLARVDQPADPQLLALVIERATHQRYASYLSQAVWRRVGAADAWLWLDRPGGAAHADCCMIARQGDWIRVGELLLKDGNYRGEEVIRPGWVALMRAPSKADPDYGAFVQLATHTAPGGEPYVARDVFVVEGAGGNRLWVVPSLQIAILCTGAPAGRDAAWDDARIPNLVIRAARDFVPAAARPATGVSALVPGH
jgi:CubicO group peptidase (beta-lactamase class C family)